MNIRHALVVSLSLFSVPAIAVEVEKSAWVDHMSTAIPVMFCKSDQFFRQCYEVSPQECEEVTSSAARLCIDKYRAQIPEILVQPQDGTHWGTIVGQCVGNTYDVALVKKKTLAGKCKDPSQWQ